MVMGLDRWKLSLFVALVGCGIGSTNRQQIGTEITCGNFQIEAGEICDDGNTVDGDGCAADCKSDEACGNGVIDSGENCDDSNALDGDGCSADCTSDETCGNGVIDRSKGETCDDNNLISGDGCSANCQSNEACGNNIVDQGEACDRGGFANNCDPDCTLPKCGDQVFNQLAGEECEDHNLTNGDGCDSQCRVEMCGNSRRENNEACDSGGALTASCDSDCTLPVCGDGVKNPAAGDECDDHNTSSGDGCDRFCHVENCGNGRREDNEACDTGGNSPSCDSDCTPVQCNDGHLNAAAGEQCEDGNLSSGDGCTSGCRWEPRVYLVDTSGVIGQNYDYCGNGHLYTCDPSIETGFVWTDATPFTPSQIRIEIDHSINCYGSYQLATNLNGTYAGDVAFDNPDGCRCDSASYLVEETISSAGYNVGGANELRIAGAPDCHGYSVNLGLGGYARITVYP